MSADEGVGYVSPITYQCLFRPAFDNIRATHSNSAEAVEAINESYLRMQANAPNDDLSLPDLAHLTEYATISQRAINLRRVLARIPQEMTDRRAFLETIREIAGSIRDLLEVANQIIKAVPPTVHPVIEKRKREFVRYSKQFSNTLKEYFRDQNAIQVFMASNLLIFQTIQLIRCIRERIRVPANSHDRNGSK
ncbi:hypothetical protein M3Y97_00494800 [Aphelenchoides bicaudatus]|nr:hypothetical protein M3Y97_00494800 [Aphelenchoides bicaudatus]